jgi:hypothetical protein
VHDKRAAFATGTIARDRVQAWSIRPHRHSPDITSNSIDSEGALGIGRTSERSVRGRAEKRDDPEINVKPSFERVVLMGYRGLAIGVATMRALFHDAQSSVQ